MFRSDAIFAPKRLLVIILTALLAFSPLTVMAAPVAQFGSSGDDDAAALEGTPQLLGEYAFVDMANGDTYSAVIVIPESGDYLITAVDDEAAQDFDLVVTDEAGNELYNEIFDNIELTLETGTIQLTFTAVADNQLGYVMLGNIGGMSEDQNEPGKLVPGSIYVNEEVNDALYATVSVPPSTYPRAVLIAFQPGENDTFYTYVEGENTYEYASTDDSDIISFWTHGGDFNLSVEPYERRSEISVAVFVTGEPQSIAFNEPFEDEIPAGWTETVYEVQLDTNYTDLELTVESEEDLGVSLQDAYYDYDVYYSSYGEDELEIDSLFPGVYYVVVQAPEAYEEDVPLTLTITGEAGNPTTVLENGTAVSDEFDGEASLNYSFDVANPGAMVTITMSGEDEDNDFDLTAGLTPGGTTWSSYSTGPDETLTFLAPVAGTYYISVISNDYAGEFTIQADEGDPAQTLDTNALLFDSIEAHSENLYLLPITEGGRILSVIMVGPENADLDLAVTGYNSDGDSILNLNAYSSGSAEAVSYLLPEAGLYEVAVSSDYSDEGGYFFIQAQVIDPRYFGSLWASDATASSQYGEENYSAMQATGASDTPSAGDFSTAWASAEPDAGVETLELTFDVPVRPSGLLIYESFNPGAITTIEAYDSENDEWVAIYEGEAGPVEELYRAFSPEITLVDFATDQIRLTLDTAAVEGFNEIDAVQLFGRP